VQERSVWITPEKAFVTGEMAEKRFALLIGRVPGYIPSTIIGAAPPHFVAYIFLTYKYVLLVLPPSKSNALSKNKENQEKESKATPALPTMNDVAI